MWQVILGASISIVLYLFLSVVSFLHWYPLYQKKCEIISSFDENFLNPANSGFNRGRRYFFFLLMLSSILDQPFFITCLAMGGPEGCSWGETSNIAVWMLHLISLTGYFICMGIPLKLWSDIINGKDGDILGCSKYDVSKAIIHVSSGLYFVIIVLEAIALIIIGPTKQDHSRLIQFFRGIEAIFYALMALWWLLNGIRLAYFVKRVMPKNGQEKRLLFNASVVMGVILVSYLLRTVLIMGAGLGRYFGYRKINILKEHYVFWLAGTRWLPYIICSFLLIFVLRLSEKSKTPGGSGYSGYSSILKSEEEEEDDSDNNIVIDDCDNLKLAKYFDNSRSPTRDTVYFDDSGSSFASFWLNNIWGRDSAGAAPETDHPRDREASK